MTSDMGSGPSERHLCLPCADIEEEEADRANKGLNHAAVLMITGLLTLTLCAGADVFKFGLAEGFGFWQWSGIALGSLLILIGAIVQTATLWVIGVFTIGLTLMAEWLRFGAEPGFGYKQILGCLGGVILIIAGLRLSRDQNQLTGYQR